MYQKPDLMFLFCVLLLTLPAVAPAQLVILSETDTEKDGLPVFTEHADSDFYREALSRGLPARMVRLYSQVQYLLASETTQTREPAYLLVSNNQGGFPRFGFYLADQKKPDVGYVDLMGGSQPVGDFGALDQLFPHELAHVIVTQLAGPPPATPPTQIHAIGVVTNRVTAFQEGFAEHFQVIAIDDETADPQTRALAADVQTQEQADKWVHAYRRDLAATWHPTRQITFPLKFGRTEQIMRYFQVRMNGFVHEPQIPASLLERDDVYRAYLLENLAPGEPGSALRPTARLVAMEGVISSFFWQWTNTPALRQQYEGEEFYRSFGIERTAVDQLDNVYLKLFHVFHRAQPQDVTELITHYKRIFPDDAPAVAALALKVFGSGLADLPDPIWLENPDFKVGTTIYDQFRSLPRNHYFDLNAASVVDLLAVPGMDQGIANKIRQNAPYRDLSELPDLDIMPAELDARFAEMARLATTQSKALEIDSEHELSLSTILMPYATRAVIIILSAAVMGAFAIGQIRSLAWYRALLYGFGAALTGISATWLIGAEYPVVTIVVPLLLFGVPAALWTLIRRRNLRESAQVVLSWSAAALPGALVLLSW